MKRFLKLCSIMAIAAAFSVSVLGGQAKAVSNGSPARQVQGAVSIWNYDEFGVFRHRCTASLVHPYWAVTGAHCTFARETPNGVRPPALVKDQSSVRTSSLDNTQGHQEVGVDKVIIHEDYNGVPNQDLPTVNDIVLIKFKHPVSDPQQIPLLPSASPAVGTQGRVAGWGWTCDDTVGTPGALPNCGLPLPTLLQQTNLEIVADSRCGWFSDPNGQLCTVGANGQFTMACRGDSGGPLVRKSLDKFVLMGFVLSDGDYEIGHPDECDKNINGGQGTGLFLDIAAYKPWILDKIANN